MIRSRMPPEKLPPPVMEVTTDPGEVARVSAIMAQFKRNQDWVDANANEVYRHRGKYFCIAGQQLFVGDDVLELVARARTAHPDDQGLFTGYIPKEKAIRVYAHRR